MGEGWGTTCMSQTRQSMLHLEQRGRGDWNVKNRERAVGDAVRENKRAASILMSML